jgi:ribosomal protein S18 acetylase RimI-like enzyme
MDSGIRPFAGTARDARAILSVDRATFGDCHYPAAYIVELESDPRQRAWVAEQDGRVVGFVSAFATRSLAGDRWEIDELAVEPGAQKRGWGTALVARAIHDGGTRHPGFTARALVATRNRASQRVFEKNGFSSVAQVDLLLYEVLGRVPRPPQPGMPEVRQALAADAAALSRLSGRAVNEVLDLIERSGNLYLVAVLDGQVQGCAELLHIRTLQYEGFWVESMATDDRAACVPAALFNAAVEEAKRCGAIDEVGYLALPGERVLYTACVGQGFKKIDEYLVYVRDLEKRGLSTRGGSRSPIGCAAA